MRRYLIILIIFCISVNKVCGQSAPAAIDSLVKYHIIAPGQRHLVESEVKRYSNVPYRVAILAELKSIGLKEIFHIKPHQAYHTFYRYHITYPVKMQDSANGSLRVLLQHINSAGLLTSRIYASALKGIDSGRYALDVQLIGQLEEMTYRLLLLAPDKLLPVAEQLHKAGVVPDSAFTRLNDDIRNEKIESVSQLIGYCSLARTFNMKKYPDDPKIWIEQLHHDIASMLPGINFTDFKYAILPDTVIDKLPETPYVITLGCNGRTYQYANNNLNLKNDSGKVFFDATFAEGFYRIFNKILADQRSPYRLHLVMFSPQYLADFSIYSFSLIALREEQTEMLWKDQSQFFMMVSRDDYDGTLTSARIDTLITGWKKMGLFAQLSGAQISKGIEKVQTDNWYSTEGLLGDFPDMVYTMRSAMEEDARYPYRNLLMHLAGLTRGAFKPTAITQQKLEHGGVRLQYVFNGSKHSFTFPTKYGWLDNDFPAFVKHLCKENNLPGNFYNLGYGDSLIYLTRAQYDYAVKNNLLDFAEERRKGGK